MGTGTAWLTGPAFVPIVPIFPISWLLWWMREGLEDKDLIIWVTVKESAAAIRLDLAKWAIQADTGESISPTTTEMYEAARGGMNGIRYATKGRSFEQFTLQPCLLTADSTEVVLPVVTFRHVKGTIMTFSP